MQVGAGQQIVYSMYRAVIQNTVFALTLQKMNILI